MMLITCSIKFPTVRIVPCIGVMDIGPKSQLIAFRKQCIDICRMYSKGKWNIAHLIHERFVFLHARSQLHNGVQQWF